MLFYRMALESDIVICTSLALGTGVDPVTPRSSGGRRHETQPSS
jgi:hypothetical protein